MPAHYRSDLRKRRYYLSNLTGEIESLPSSWNESPLECGRRFPKIQKSLQVRNQDEVLLLTHGREPSGTATAMGNLLSERMNMKVVDRLFAVALERDLRKSTVLEYKRSLGRLNLLDLEVDTVSLESISEALWEISNPNTRRNSAIAVRAVLGLSIRIPKAVSRRYNLPDEDTLRLALMTSPHEIRGLLMMYGGLRLGEACAITRLDVSGDRLRVDKQIQALRETGKPTIVRTAQVKTYEDDIVIPLWLAERVSQITETAKPDGVRESIRRAGSRVGIALNPHQLRHWYATTALERGVPVVVVSKQLRHSDISTTLKVYAQHDTGKHVHSAFG